jgi:hypothetical protein
MEAIALEMGNTKRFTIEESLVPRAAEPCTQSFIGLERPREVSSTGPTGLIVPVLAENEVIQQID